MSTPSKDSVLVAMSGGVDSSVAALLLQQSGYHVVGVTMRLYTLDTNTLPSYYKGCCSLDDVEDARRVCEKLNVSHYVIDARKEFQDHVVNYFLAEYQQGRTPHPCIACNDTIKFDFLLKRAEFLGMDYIATGHYARIRKEADGHHLLKGLDSAKDQSYALYGMGQQELSHCLMPVGEHPKDVIRSMAQQAGFPNAAKPDSQEICFIPFGDYRKFLSERLTPQSGNFVDRNGNILGKHQGIEFFTIGQRHGLGITSTSPLFVTHIDPDSGDVTVGARDDLLNDTLTATQMRYVSGATPTKNFEASVKIRYKSMETPAIIYPEGDKALLRFDTPQRAITPGQSAVLYRDEEVLGGGRIALTRTTSSIQPNMIGQLTTDAKS